MKYLIAHRSLKAREGLKRALQKSAQAVVETCETGTQALKLVQQGQYDLIILDSKLKKKSGVAVSETLRSLKIFTPIIMLAGSKKERIQAFLAGADSSPPLPLNLDELRAEINSLIRRHTLYHRHHQKMNIGDFLFDQQNLQLFHNETEIILTNIETRLIEYLIVRKEQLVTRDELRTKVWGKMSAKGSNSVDVYIAHLRKKTDKRFGTSHIRSLRGKGYMLTDKTLPDGISAS